MNANKLLKKWIDKTISAEELKMFKKLPEYEDLIAKYEKTDNLNTAIFDKSNASKKRLSGKNSNLNENNLGAFARIPNWIKIAIPALLILALLYFFIPKKKSVSHKKVEDKNIVATNSDVKTVDFPDGSKCTLFGNSTVDFGGKSWDDKRIVTLKGKGTFTVEKGNLFIVSTKNGKVDVLSGVVTVNTENDLMKVKVKHGEVEVSSIDNKFKETLYTKESSIIQHNTAMLSKKMNLTKMRNVEVQTVLDELSKQFKISFEHKNVDLKKRISCNFQHDNIPLAFRSTLNVLNLKYKMQNKQVYLESK